MTAMAEEKSVFEIDPTIESPNGQVNGKVNLVDASGNALFTSTGLVLSGDTRLYTGAGVPVDYTDGTPPATGEGEAGIGSLYLDTTNGKAYINGGTKAQPVWKLVTSAA
jgi:hypothetical protein